MKSLEKLNQGRQPKRKFWGQSPILVFLNVDFIAKYIYTEFNSRFDEEDDSMFINVVQDGVNAKSTKVRRFKFGTHDLNVTTKEINLTDEEGNLTSTIYNI